MNKRYEKILNLSETESEKHPKMPIEERAAQFAPFAALTGFESSVEEKARLTDRKIELDDYEMERIDSKLRFILNSEERIKIKITYFIKDERKSGGKYITKHAYAVKADEYSRKLLMSDGSLIQIEDIIDIAEV